MFEIELTIYIKMDLALNNLQRLIYHKANQHTHKQISCYGSIVSHRKYNLNSFFDLFLNNFRYSKYDFIKSFFLDFIYNLQFFNLIWLYSWTLNFQLFCLPKLYHFFVFNIYLTRNNCLINFFFLLFCRPLLVASICMRQRPSSWMDACILPMSSCVHTHVWLTCRNHGNTILVKCLHFFYPHSTPRYSKKLSVVENVPALAKSGLLATKHSPLLYIDAETSVWFDCNILTEISDIQ